jgi:hypothetical protein
VITGDTGEATAGEGSSGQETVVKWAVGRETKRR